MLLLMTCLLHVGAQTGAKGAEIKFDKVTHDFGKFSESSPKVSCVFTYTNVGDSPLIIKSFVHTNVVPHTATVRNATI